jgi:hypothetical protein
LPFHYIPRAEAHPRGATERIRTVSLPARLRPLQFGGKALTIELRRLVLAFETYPVLTGFGGLYLGED